MRRQDWLLLFVYLPISGPKERPQLDPIRIMKGMFLFCQKSNLGKEEAYDFEPYLYGPCSFEIYRDLDALVDRGLIAEERSWGRSWSLYTPTRLGIQKMEDLLPKVSPALLDILRSIKEKVVSTGFRVLLREIYKAYPHYATESVFSFR